MCTAFLSMWTSNTATTAMMVLIVNAVLGELEQDEKRAQQSADDADHEPQNQDGVHRFAGKVNEPSSITASDSKKGEVVIIQDTTDHQPNNLVSGRANEIS